MKVLKVIKNPYKLLAFLGKKGLLNSIPSDKYLKILFKGYLGKKLNLENPVGYNEKLQWLKLYWYDEKAIECADKYAVRYIVQNSIGKEYLNELYGIYDSVEEINLEKLPKSFVLKGTHGSGYNIVCKDKDKLDWDLCKKKMKKWLKSNYYLGQREWVYKDIKPRIICEKFIEQEDGKELRDYRFFCFNGEPKFITVDFNIMDKKKTRRNLYDLDWNLMKEEISYPRELNEKVEKPRKLDEMIQLSKKLSKNFPHSRVDFYYINENILFGEITFFHQSGMGKIKPIQFEKNMGDWIDISKVKIHK